MNLLEEQIKLEQESIDYGVDHYRSQVQEAKNTQRESTTLKSLLSRVKEADTQRQQ